MTIVRMKFWRGIGGGFALIGIVIGMSVWRAREAQTITTYGSARLATNAEARRAGLLEPTGSYSAVMVTTIFDNGPEHVLCFAPTRSGKGVDWSPVAPDLARFGHRPRHQGRELAADGRLARPLRPCLIV